MENALVVGINTRSVACSLKKLGFNVYSADYFGTIDLQECTHNYLSILSQKPHHSCGHFTLNYKSGSIDDLAAQWVDDADFIICLAGSSPLNFPQKKILGNKDIGDVENKYKLYRKLKNHFQLPRTYCVADIEEADEISGNYPEKEFILKPISGSGGYGIKELKMLDEKSDLIFDFSEFILQERLNGQNISSSVLSTGSKSHTVLTSQQIIGDTDLGQKEPYGYCGNITPFIDDNNAAGIAEEIINHLSLVGSNGVDFILQDDDLFLIEVNPRIQGTIECAEASLGLNMVEAHLEASRGTLIDVPPPNRFAVKMIVHARKRSQVGRMNFEGVYDIPAENVIIEEGEPVATVVSSSEVLEDAIYSAQQMVSKVYSLLKVHP
ncbi:MAG: carbamoyl phosphate synthase-like protein [Methanobacterium sp. PtaU1.Bin242]|nr:MAG: carbamoyl phosphate synthase-like protein [Methanobacterium sp. PtaU1.Bin242]